MDKGGFDSEKRAGEIWELARRDVSERMGDLIPGAPPSLESEAPNISAIGGKQDRWKNMIGNETGQTWPAIGEMYTSYYQEHGRYRAGGRGLPTEIKLL